MLHFSQYFLIDIIYNKRLSDFQAIHSASKGSGHFWQFQTNIFQLLQLASNFKNIIRYHTRWWLSLINQNKVPNLKDKSIQLAYLKQKSRAIVTSQRPTAVSSNLACGRKRHAATTGVRHAGYKGRKKVKRLKMQSWIRAKAGKCQSKG